MREKNREASAASSRSEPLVPFLSAAIAMTPKPDCAAAFRVAREDLYDVGDEAAVCAAQHFHANFLADSKARRRPMIDGKRGRVSRRSHVVGKDRATQ